MFQSGLRKALERREEERHVSARFLEVGIGRHDVEDDTPAGAPARMPATYRAFADGVRPETARADTRHPAPRNRSLEHRPQVQRRRRRHNRPRSNPSCEA